MNSITNITVQLVSYPKPTVEWRTHTGRDTIETIRSCTLPSTLQQTINRVRLLPSLLYTLYLQIQI
jgi:hypothetical protein